ncbi:MAG: hypothetical protein V4484_18605 [Pseudomonadota bacterium]
MSEKSFAVASVSVAIVWGTFFYPPTPRAAKPAATEAAAVVAKPVARPAAVLHAIAANNNCILNAAHDAPGCAPLHKLASD